jgi:sirohydrochlorin cobaltochelatase
MTVMLPVPARHRPGVAPALLMVAHGSADPAAAATHARLAVLVRDAAPGLEVGLAHVDHTAPSVAAALDAHAAAGRQVVAVPLLLSAAAHSKGDIPGAIRAAARRHGGPPAGYAAVLGPHPLLLTALVRRLAEAGVGADTALVLAAAGSADPDANAEVARTARLLWEWRGGPPVEPAYASATVPTVADAVDRLRRLGHDRIAVASYFLAPGRLPAAVRAAAAGLPVTEPLGDTGSVAALVLERYAEAVAGHAAANCDTCQHRAPWPGREHKVGTPQRPHRHPADDHVTG